jgi:hypothetical protein
LAHTHPAEFQANGSGFSSVSSRNTASGNTGSTGGNAAMNNMQPFITVYMWQRTA